MTEEISLLAEDRRNKILSSLAKYTGRQVSWKFIKQTEQFIPGIERFHNLITGIFKPAWSEYALSIVIRANSLYEDKDEVIHLDDGRWLMTYSPRLVLQRNVALSCFGSGVQAGKTP